MAASRRVYDSRHCRLTAKNRILHYNIFFYCHVCSEIGVKLCVLGTSSIVTFWVIHVGAKISVKTASKVDNDTARFHFRIYKRVNLIILQTYLQILWTLSSDLSEKLATVISTRVSCWLAKVIHLAYAHSTATLIVSNPENIKWFWLRRNQ